MEKLSDLERLERLFAARTPLVTIRTYEEAHALEILREAALARGGLAIWSVLDGVRDGLVAQSESLEGTTNAAAGLYCLRHQQTWPVMCLIDVAAHLDEPAVLRSLRELIAHAGAQGETVVLLDHADRLPEAIEAHAVDFELSLPDEEELERIVRFTVRRLHEEAPFDIDLTKQQLARLVSNLRGLTRRQAERVVVEIVRDDAKLNNTDIERALDLKRQHVKSGGLLEFTRAPTSMDEIGGMDGLKGWLRQREHAFDDETDRPRGVMLLGVQGAGKSLCAKAIATAWRRPLLRMDVGTLYDKYIGETERRLRESLHQAEMMAPVILWIDEIEKAFASSASQSTDGGLSRRLFGSLLTWMQEHRSPVFLVATANDIEALPPELLRKGRFDEIFFVDLPSEKAREAVFRIHLERRGLGAGSFDLGALVRESAGFSGAEIEQAVVSARHAARTKKRGIETQDVLEALGNSPPLSVTMAERIESLRAWSRGRCVPAG